MSKVDLGSVSAFDIAVKNGYAGTEADWVNDIANASENAEAAQQSASQASSAAAASRADYTEVMSDFDVLSARMDEFTSLEEGSTTGDAELADIRVGYDGTTYDNAGTAVRTQIEAAMQSGSGSGLTEDIKAALLQIASKVAYIDEDGQDYYDALYDALYPPADLVSISAVYTQSGTVYDTDTLDDLKSDLVVTALYDDQSTETVTTYTLSGTLTVGTSTITVAYGGKTTTFNVTVTQAPVLPLYQLCQGTKTTSGNSVTISGNHITFNIVDNSRTFWVDDTEFYNALPSSTFFNLSQGDSYEFRLKNIAFTSNTSTGNYFAVAGKNSSNDSVITTGNQYYTSTAAGTLPDATITGTVESDSAITSLLLFCYRGAVFEFDLELYVNGTRYI